MACDLSRTPTTGLRLQCCGDAHLSNFGVFAAPDRAVVFDLNDFDETLPAPFEWDVKRQGERVVHGQRLMQAAGDAFLGWVTGTGTEGHEFYVRQLRDKKGSAEVELMTPERLALYGRLCGATLARAHARTGNAAKITGYLGEDDTFGRALERFAVAYADHNETDYAAFTEAAESQRIEVLTGV